MSLNPAQQAAYLSFLWEMNKHQIKGDAEYLARKVADHDRGDPTTRKWSAGTKAQMVQERNRRQTLLNIMPAITEDEKP